MRQPLVRDESLAEYFKRLVEAAIENQRVPALDLTEYYLVQLLAMFSRTDCSPSGGTPSEPLALRLGRALETAGSRQRAELRQVGDESLFIAGFFSESLRRSLVDVDYYVSLGAYAYGSLSQEETGALAPVFAELAQRFVAFADVLSEVSEASSLTCDADVLRLYERWARSGSRRSGEALVRMGIVPNAQSTGRLIH
jgi:hypothetical protein